jgi:hypothetical protein
LKLEKLKEKRKKRFKGKIKTAPIDHAWTMMVGTTKIVNTSNSP